MDHFDIRSIALAALALCLVGCADEAAPAPEPADPPAAEATDPDAHLTPNETYQKIVASLGKSGAAEAQAAWDSGKPAMLLFSASW